jgi:hypothetical protein
MEFLRIRIAGMDHSKTKFSFPKSLQPNYIQVFDNIPDTGLPALTEPLVLHPEQMEGGGTATN